MGNMNRAAIIAAGGNPPKKGRSTKENLEIVSRGVDLAGLVGIMKNELTPDKNKDNAQNRLITLSEKKIN